MVSVLVGDGVNLLLLLLPVNVGERCRFVVVVIVGGVGGCRHR